MIIFRIEKRVFQILVIDLAPEALVAHLGERLEMQPLRRGVRHVERERLRAADQLRLDAIEFFCDRAAREEHGGRFLHHHHDAGDVRARLDDDAVVHARDTQFPQPVAQSRELRGGVERDEDASFFRPVIAEHLQLARGEIVFRTENEQRLRVVGDALDVHQVQRVDLDVLMLDERLEGLQRIAV